MTKIFSYNWSKTWSKCNDKKKGGYVHQILFATRMIKIFGCAQSKTLVIIQQPKKRKVERSVEF